MPADTSIASEIGSVESTTAIPEFNNEYLAKELPKLNYLPAEMPVDPYTYSILFNSTVRFEGTDYELVYKVCKNKKDSIVAKLSLVNKDFFDNPNSTEELLNRVPESSRNLSEKDTTLLGSESAYRTLKIDFEKDPINVLSYLEVAKSMRGKGLGTILFNQTELLALDLIRRSPQANDRSVALIIRDASKGWATSRSKQMGYEEVPLGESASAFPTYRKIIPPSQVQSTP